MNALETVHKMLADKIQSEIDREPCESRRTSLEHELETLKREFEKARSPQQEVNHDT